MALSPASTPSQRVVVLGASTNPQRYSYLAVERLREKGHTVIPVHPLEAAVQGLPVVKNLREVSGAVDTVTVYVRPELVKKELAALLALRPKRVIFNPGSYDEASAARLRDAGIAVQESCTLVLLRTNQF